MYVIKILFKNKKIHVLINAGNKLTIKMNIEL